jgi:hypothetical protein
MPARSRLPVKDEDSSDVFLLHHETGVFNVLVIKAVGIACCHHILNWRVFRIFGFGCHSNCDVPVANHPPRYGADHQWKVNLGVDRASVAPHLQH